MWTSGGVGWGGQLDPLDGKGARDRPQLSDTVKVARNVMCLLLYTHATMKEVRCRDMASPHHPPGSHPTPARTHHKELHHAVVRPMWPQLLLHSRTPVDLADSNDQLGWLAQYPLMAWLLGVAGVASLGQLTQACCKDRQGGGEGRGLGRDGGKGRVARRGGRERGRRWGVLIISTWQTRQQMLSPSLPPTVYRPNTNHKP